MERAYNSIVESLRTVKRLSTSDLKFISKLHISSKLDSRSKSRLVNLLHNYGNEFDNYSSLLCDVAKVEIGIDFVSTIQVLLTIHSCSLNDAIQIGEKAFPSGNFLFQKQNQGSTLVSVRDHIDKFLHELMQSGLVIQRSGFYELSNEGNSTILNYKRIYYHD